MNPMNTLQRAMIAVDEESEATAAGVEAVAVAIAVAAAAVNGKTEAEAQRQRDLDAALADAIEVVARHRSRLGRRTCSRHDGETVRRVFELLRGLMGDTNDQFP